MSVTAVSISFAVPIIDKSSLTKLTVSFPVEPDIDNVELSPVIVEAKEELTASNSV